MNIPTGWCTCPYRENITRLVIIQRTMFLSHDEWPHSSPDLNPCDYYLWGRLKAIVNNKSYDNILALKLALVKAWSELDQGEVARACNLFPDRVRHCLKARGNRFESK